MGMEMEINTKFLKFQQMKYNLFKSQDPKIGLFDVIFEIDGKVIYAHKTMLNLVSPTFASMLSDRWMKNKDEPIKIKDYCYADFYQFLTFLYSAQCQLTESNIYSMVDIAEFYGIELFKDYCEEYLSSMEIATENIFRLIDLADKYSMAQLKSSTHAFICKNFQSFVDCDGFLKADKQVIEEIVVSIKDEVMHEDLFQAVFKWSEKQAMDKQSIDSNLNLCDQIKAEISSFLLHISFDKMELKFLHEFVVSRGYIFSYKELSKILSDRYSITDSLTKVKITNSIGQTLYGKVIPDETVIADIKSINLSNESRYNGWKQVWWEATCKLPSTPSPLKKRDHVEWYLIRFSDGDIGITPSTIMLDNHYLLAELTAFTNGFEVTQNCKIEIE